MSLRVDSVRDGLFATIVAEEETTRLCPLIDAVANSLRDPPDDELDPSLRRHLRRADDVASVVPLIVFRAYDELRDLHVKRDHLK